MASVKHILSDIESISGKKENLKKAFEALKSHASSLASFSLQWKDLEEYVASTQRSIEDRFSDLEAKEKEASITARIDPEREPEVDPRPELKSFCVKMDGKGLLRFLCRNRKDITNIWKELNPAIRAASDPAKLVLDAVRSFFVGDGQSEGEIYGTRRNCILLMERLISISAEIKPPVREKAMALAHEWKMKMAVDGGKNHVEALGFLQLLASYKLSSEFDADELLNLLVPVVKRKQAIDLCKSLGFSEKIPDFIQKLSEKGKFIGAVKFAYAFGLVDRFPPVPFLKEHVKDSLKMAEEVRKKGNNSSQAQNEATAKEIAALKAVIKTIEEFKLESEYPPKSIQERISELEQRKAEKKRSVSQAGLSKLKGQAPASKRPRPLNMAAAYPHYPQSQPILSMVDRSPYMASAGPYGPGSSNYLYERSSSGYGLNPMGLGGVSRTPPRSVRYPDPVPGSSLYDRPGGYPSYPMAGGLPSQYNSSLYR